MERGRGAPGSDSCPRRRAFDELAPRWDTMTREGTAPAGPERGLALLGDLSGARVVDLGCGTGRLEGVLLPRLGDGSVVAVDFSPAMLGEASRRLDDPRVTWLCSDVHAAGIAPGSADVVLCFDAFPHFHTPAALLGAVARWLRPDGAFLLWHDIGREALASVHRRAGPAVENDLLPPVSDLAKLVAAAGLAVEVADEDDASYTLLARRAG